MSLLREAEKCVANQRTFARLNAFITPLHQSGSWQDGVREAETRRENGLSSLPTKMEYSGFLTEFLFMLTLKQTQSDLPSMADSSQ